MPLPSQNPRKHTYRTAVVVAVVVVAHLVPEQGRVGLEGRRSGLVDRVVLRRLDKHELESEDDGVDAEHRPPVLGEDGQGHEPRVDVDIRVPRSGGARHRRRCEMNTGETQQHTRSSTNGGGW